MTTSPQQPIGPAIPRDITTPGAGIHLGSIPLTTLGMIHGIGIHGIGTTAGMEAMAGIRLTRGAGAITTHGTITHGITAGVGDTPITTGVGEVTMATTVQ